MTLADKIRDMLQKHPDMSPALVAGHFGCHPAYVRAARARGKRMAAGGRAEVYRPRPRISAQERAERQIDQRDIDMLFDLRDGHTIRDTAKHWGVSYNYLQALAKTAKEPA